MPRRTFGTHRQEMKPGNVQQGYIHSFIKKIIELTASKSKQFNNPMKERL